MKRLEERRQSGTIDSINSLHVDLMIEILTKLPPGSVSKLICVSKLWSSIIQGKHFSDLYLTRSSTRPLLLGLLYLPATRLYQYSFSQENPSSDHSVSPKMIPGYPISPPVHGLICSIDVDADVFVANPTMGQFLTLPRINSLHSSLFGYDPVNDLYKVFSMTRVTDKHGHLVSVDHYVFTLGAQKTWRMIECKCPHYPVTLGGICKDGVVYYLARSKSYSPHNGSYVVVSLDIRSEEFSLMTLPDCVRIEPFDEFSLVSYNGKIALVNHSRNGKFDLWVLMDVIKQEWTKISVLVRCWKDLVGNRVYCRGTISTGELLFEPCNFHDKLFIIYYNPKEDKARRVYFEKSGDGCIRCRMFVDHIESLMFLPWKV
ncbi:unnamed protein product [Microthlaspi erraticum]|uniref:F-box domain-containing protein n=1 Tax=Microthlaspi erraticum TaxID=1685480 RepID=A0A6D2K3Y1_9BRAS|nr:unnamed protein product [Microthlaspi erraticum]